MRLHHLTILLVLAIAGCKPNQQQPIGNNQTNQVAATKKLPEARQGFTTKLARRESDGTPIPNPPPSVFRKVQFESPAGKLGALLSPDPKDGKKHPAIIWITGGDCNTIDAVWKKAPRNDDQTASQYREAGIPMMFPALRGGNDNPGVREGFFGEVDDVLAAADFLRKQDFIDPNRIYLGGHSTGGTLVFLVAASSDKFRAVFSFGPADDVANYPNEFTPFDKRSPREVELRSPGRWLHSVQSPTFVFEGTIQGNIDSLRKMQRESKNPKLEFYPVNGASHFTILAPTNELIARKILADTGETSSISFTTDELNQLFKR